MSVDPVDLRNSQFEVVITATNATALTYRLGTLGDTYWTLRNNGTASNLTVNGTFSATIGLSIATNPTGRAAGATTASAAPSKPEGKL